MDDATEETSETATSEAAVETTPDELTQLREELEKLRIAHAELNDRYLREAAEFDNTRKRMRAEQAQRLQFANERLISELLPVLDNLERALALDRAPVGSSGTEATALRNGVELTARMFAETLARYGVSTIAAVGEVFDPTKHEAIVQVESSAHAEGVIVEEAQRGYALNDRVIRPSLVKVATSPRTEPPTAEN